MRPLMGRLLREWCPVCNKPSGEDCLFVTPAGSKGGLRLKEKRTWKKEAANG